MATTAAWRSARGPCRCRRRPRREIVIPVQVNGKVRGRITVSPEATDAELEALALADPSVQPHLQGKSVKKVVVARGRLVSIVVG